MRRGEIWWASLPEPSGSGPGFRRPLLIVSANSFNDSRISTVVAAVITSNLRLADALEFQASLVAFDLTRALICGGQADGI